jgi:TRAP-type C4-dicarboxylate transport system permease large subunit
MKKFPVDRCILLVYKRHTLGKVGIDPVHFGVVMTLNLMIGLLTPPVGLNLYIVLNIAEISFWRPSRAQPLSSCH